MYCVQPDDGFGIIYSSATIGFFFLMSFDYFYSLELRQLRKTPIKRLQFRTTLAQSNSTIGTVSRTVATSVGRTTAITATGTASATIWTGATMARATTSRMSYPCIDGLHRCNEKGVVNRWWEEYITLFSYVSS